MAYKNTLAEFVKDPDGMPIGEAHKIYHSVQKAYRGQQEWRVLMDENRAFYPWLVSYGWVVPAAKDYRRVRLFYLIHWNTNMCMDLIEIILNYVIDLKTCCIMKYRDILEYFIRFHHFNDMKIGWLRTWKFGQSGYPTACIHEALY